jgi:hypothetical protein
MIITTAGAQMFRALGLIKFVHIAYDTFKDSPSSYYPTVIFGPILFGAILGNMGGFFWSGFEGYLHKGMPYAFQNGIFFASFYHFYVNDRDGFVGMYLRKILSVLPSYFNLTEQSFAVFIVSACMQIVGILQLPILLGPSFNPFLVILHNILIANTSKKIEKSVIISTPTVIKEDNIDQSKKESSKPNVTFRQDKNKTSEDKVKKNKNKTH